jgi:glutaredoxin
MRTNPPDHIVILTTSWCPYCHALKQALNASRLPYDSIDIERDWQSQYAHYSTRRSGIPVTVIGSTIVGGALVKQLSSIRTLCERINPAGQYNCAKLVALGG